MPLVPAGGKSENDKSKLNSQPIAVIRHRSGIECYGANLRVTIAIEGTRRIDSNREVRSDGW